MKINTNSRILVLSDAVKGAHKYHYAFDCVPRNIAELGYATHNLTAEKLDFDAYRKAISEFKPDLIFCYLQLPPAVIKIAGFLKAYHPVPAINWYLEDPNCVVVRKNSNINILDATACFDYWFSQDARMRRFWKTRSVFIPPGFDDAAYCDPGLEKIYDVSYIGQLGRKQSMRMYWPYMKELARYGKKAMLCLERPMGIPLLPRPLEKFIHSRKRRTWLQKWPFWKCGWINPADEKEKCRIINQSKIHFGMVRVVGEWERPLKQLLPDYPLDRHGLFYQLKGRLFQAVGGGAMAMNEYCPELEDLFDVGKEIVTFEYGNVDEVREKLAWYLSHDAERQKIAKAGYGRGRKDHTFRRRVEQILDIIRKDL